MIAVLVITLGVVSTVLFIRSRTGADTSKKNTFKSANPYEDLGISEYQYPTKFTLEDELEAAITTVALSYDEFDENTISDKEWEDEFTRLFLKNSRYVPAYVMDNAENNNRR